MSDFTVGQQYQLNQHVGFDPSRTPVVDPIAALNDPELERVARLREGLMPETHHPLFADQIGTVVDVVPAGVAGGGPLDQETVVLEFDHLQLVNHVPGKTTPESVPTGLTRRASFTAQQMAEWFTPVAPAPPSFVPGEAV
jgi:hypothetical protein